MSLAKKLLEEIKELEGEKGQYKLEFDLAVDLSHQFNIHKDSDNEEDVDIAWGDVGGVQKTSYIYKTLDDKIWREIKHIPGVQGAALELEYQGKEPTTISAAKEAAKNAKYKATVTIDTDMDSDNKTVTKNGIEKAIQDIK